MVVLLSLLAMLVVAAVGWRLVRLDRPGARWRSRLGHAAWVAAHALIAGGAVWVAATALRGSIQPEPVVALLVGICLLFTGRWRRRTPERATS